MASGFAFGGNDSKEKARTRVITGKIIDQGGQAIAGARITVSETGQTIYSDLEGNYKLEVKTDKTYTISVNTIGYAPSNVKSETLSLFSDLILSEINTL